MRIRHWHGLHLARSDRVPRFEGRLKAVHDPEVHWSLGKLVLDFLNLWHFLVKRHPILFGRRLYLGLNAKREVFNGIIHILQDDPDLRVGNVGPVGILRREALA